MSSLETPTKKTHFNIIVLFLFKKGPQRSHAYDYFMRWHQQSALPDCLKEHFTIKFQNVPTATAPYRLALCFKFELETTLLNVREDEQINLVLDLPYIQAAFNIFQTITNDSLAECWLAFLPVGKEIYVLHVTGKSFGHW